MTGVLRDGLDILYSSSFLPMGFTDTLSRCWWLCWVSVLTVTLLVVVLGFHSLGVDIAVVYARTMR